VKWTSGHATFLPRRGEEKRREKSEGTVAGPPRKLWVRLVSPQKKGKSGGKERRGERKKSK